MDFYETIKGLYSEDINIVCETINTSQHIKTLKECGGFAIHTGFVCKNQKDTIFEFIYLEQRKESVLCRQVYLPSSGPLLFLGAILEYKTESQKGGSFVPKRGYSYIYNKYSILNRQLLTTGPRNKYHKEESEDSIWRIIFEGINRNSFTFQIGYKNISYPIYSELHELFLSNDYIFYKSKLHARRGYVDGCNNMEEDISMESYSKYRGTYAQDVEGCSDNFIDDALDGHPDAYWNID